MIIVSTVPIPEDSPCCNIAGCLGSELLILLFNFSETILNFYGVAFQIDLNDASKSVERDVVCV